jgi:RNA-directed DNA polymerase
MPGASKPTSVSTKCQQIADLASRSPQMRMHSLSKHIDSAWLHEAYRRIRRNTAVGVDGVTAEAYEENLDANLESLLNRFKAGTYRAPPVRRVQIPKDDGSTRPIGVPTFEDKILQRAVAMALDAVYEQDFVDFSYGFRPGRSAHDALDALREGLMAMRGGVVLELDIAAFFDSVDRTHLRAILDARIGDGVIRRAIDKWLTAGFCENGQQHRPETGTPQGGVISPILANIFLHTVLDRWFIDDVQPRMRHDAWMVRFADDAVIVFANADDANRVMRVIHQRFERFGLKLHVTKTRLVDFRRPSPLTLGQAPTFDFLGFTHCWTTSNRGHAVIKRRTSRKRLARSLQRVRTWCRRHLHDPVAQQHAHLCAMVRGHVAYFGVTGNTRLLRTFVFQVQHIWRFWLNRRSQRARMTWERYARLLQRYPLPPARVKTPWVYA